MRFLVSLFVLITVAAAGQQTVRLRGVSLAGAPDVEKEAAGGGSVWDFTGMQQLGRAEGQYIAACDSTIMELMADMRWDFVKGSRGERCIVCVEGRNWRVSVDSIPVDGRSECRDSMLLSVDLSHPYWLIGTIAQHTDPEQTIIRQPGDTVRGASLLRIRFDGIRQSMLSDSLSTPLKVERFYWFAPKMLYPTALSTTVDGAAISTYLFDDRDGDSNSAADTGSPFVQMAQTDVGESGRYTSRPVRQGVSERFSGAGSPQINVDGRTVTVAGVSDNAEVILCDIQGRLFSATTSESGTLRFAELPAGDYILSVNTGDGWQSVKFYVP